MTPSRAVHRAVPAALALLFAAIPAAARTAIPPIAGGSAYALGVEPPATSGTAHAGSPSVVVSADPITSVSQDAVAFPVSLSATGGDGVYTWSATPGTGVASVTVSGGQGTPTATFTVTLAAGFTGTASFTASLADGSNAAATQAVKVAVTAALTAPNGLVISQVYGGGGNSGATYSHDFVELFNPTANAINVGGWSIQYGSATGTSWQVQPLGGSVGPGEYYLVALGSNGATGSALPAANITGDLNLSASNGKVALVHTGEPLPAGCPAGNADLADLVGYGNANCREGATNAPAGSNTTALFRRNGGSTDTNVNGSDWVTGVPDPRRTAAIVEIGPSVLNTDPRVDGTNAPRDANIVVTFTENVTLNTGWYSINCVTSGNHDSATVHGSGRVHVIVPNTNFVPGEQCTATIFKDFVHDTDTDDSLPGTDTLSANKAWTFTVATGTAPPYAPGVHLAMGNPSGATSNTNAPDDYLMEKPEFALSYNRGRGTPNWVSWHLSDEWIGTLSRFDTFRADPAVPPSWYRVLGSDYSSSGFDRGHMVPNADRDKETSTPINQATFLMTNMLPQAPDNNQGPWANLENYLRTLVPASELYIVAGGAGVGGTGSNGFATTIAGGNVTVPEKTWKVVLVLPKDGGNDVSRVTAGTRTLAVIMPNTQGIRTSDPNDWQQYLTTVNEVERLTGYDFFSNVPRAYQSSFEAGVNGANPDPVAGFTVAAPAAVTAGVPFDVTVTARTGSSAVATTYTGRVHLGSSGAGNLPADYTFTLSDAGVKTFAVTLTATGPRSISATDVEIGSISGSASVTSSCPVLTVTASNSGPACGAIQLTAATASSGVTFAWTGPSGFTSTLPNPTTTVSGVYTVTMTGAGGCTAVASTIVEVSGTLEVTAAPQERTVAEGGTVTLSASALGNDVRYRWFLDDVPIGADPTVTFTAPSAGMHTVKVVITSSCGSVTRTSRLIVTRPRPTRRS